MLFKCSWRSWYLTHVHPYYRYVSTLYLFIQLTVSLGPTLLRLWRNWWRLLPQHQLFHYPYPCIFSALLFGMPCLLWYLWRNLTIPHHPLINKLFAGDTDEGVLPPFYHLLHPPLAVALDRTTTSLSLAALSPYMLFPHLVVISTSGFATSCPIPSSLPLLIWSHILLFFLETSVPHRFRSRLSMSRRLCRRFSTVLLLKIFSTFVLNFSIHCYCPLFNRIGTLTCLFRNSALQILFFCLVYLFLFLV